MSDIEKHLRWLRDVSGRTNLEAAAAIEALQAEVATLNVMVTDWIEAFDKQKARAEARAAIEAVAAWLRENGKPYEAADLREQLEKPT